MRKAVLLLLIVLALAVPVSATELESELTEAVGADTLSEGLTGRAAGADGRRLSHRVEKLFFFRPVAFFQSAAPKRRGPANGRFHRPPWCWPSASPADFAVQRSRQRGSVCNHGLGLLAITALCTGGLNSLIQLGAETIQNLSAYAQLLLPVLSTASMTSGAFTSAPALYAITVLFSDLLLSLITGVLIPLLYGFLAMALADCLIGTSALKRFRELLSWTVRTVLKAILYVFTGFLAITQVISGTADAMSAKAAKLTISGWSQS